MASPSGPHSVILFVVDAADFEGSFPRKTARILSSSIERNACAWKESKPANVPRIILVISKLDLLPPSMCREMIGRWMRQRTNDLGTVRLSGLHLVSATKDVGVMKLVEQVADFAGQRGNVSAVGAENAGRSFNSYWWGLMRIDVEKSSADSIYITVWASSFLPLHMGKKEI